ncbi:MAG: outer membrane protein transport protein [Halioglobus sp.]
MKTTRKNHKFALALFASVVSLISAPALLAGSPAMSGIVAVADTAESAFAAPAGMSRLEGTNVTIQTMVASSLASFDVDESKTAVPGGDPNLGTDPMVIPSLYYVRQLNDRWHAGISLTIPSGFGSNYGSDWSGRYETVDFSLVYVALTPAIAYRFNDKLSFGAGLGINYTSETSEVKIPQPLGETDGKISSDLDGVGINVTLSMLYEFTQRTRAGIAWTSDSDADLEGNVRLRKLGPVFDEVAKELGIKNVNVELTNTLPQRVLAGMYHEFESGNYFTVDGMWMKFSDFSVSNVELNGNDLNVSAPSIYNDLWAVMVGAGFPVNERLTYKVGAMYLSKAVDDEDRTFSIRLDEIWGVGAGLSYNLSAERSVDLNANVFNIGKASVDTGNGEPSRGRVVGENDDPYAVMVELTYHF